MRLGELLVATALLTVEQVEEALRAQVMWGGRLGTNLVDLGFVDLDTVSAALGRQCGLPAALASHFQRADLPLQQMLTPDVAERFQCIPLLRAGKRIVIATSQPLDERGIELVADDLVIDPERIVSSVAAELRISYQLERRYQIPRAQRFLRSKNVTSTSQLFQLRFEVDPAFDFAEPSQAAVIVRAETELAAVPQDIAWLLDQPGGDPTPEAPDENTQERRTYLRTLADLLTKHPNRDSVLARVQRIAIGTDAMRPLRVAATPSITLSSEMLGDALGASLGEAIHAIHRAPDREQLARLVIGAVAKFVDESRSALLLVVRGEAAVSWIGFCRDGTELPPLAVPLDRPGMLPAAIQRKVMVRNASGDLGAIDYLLLASLGVQYGDLSVCPIAIAEHVMSMIVIASDRGTTVETAAQVAHAAGIAFSRLMRDAGRGQGVARPSP